MRLNIFVRLDGDEVLLSALLAQQVVEVLVHGRLEFLVDFFVEELQTLTSTSNIIVNLPRSRTATLLPLLDAAVSVKALRTLRMNLRRLLLHKVLVRSSRYRVTHVKTLCLLCLKLLC